ncbi:MAG TPA: hypothetical protein VJR26_13145 [Candidatus Acidoferrales bacterium]|nr:hypothetical protein [Candidatus Acidoferrales bacterium]
MKLRSIAVAALAITTVAAWAKDPPSYDKGQLISMNSYPCGMAEKGAKTVAGEILGTDGEHKNTQEVLCQEYVLQGARIVYHIRPVDTKHPQLLPVGDTVQYRIHKDKMFVLDRENDRKEREYSVVSMQVRADAQDSPGVRDVQ